MARLLSDADHISCSRPGRVITLENACMLSHPKTPGSCRRTFAQGGGDAPGPEAESLHGRIDVVGITRDSAISRR